MPLKYQHVLIVITLLVTLVTNKGVAADFYQQAVMKYQMRMLSPIEQTQAGMNATSEKVTIAMVYQPDCQWCKKQGQWLAQLKRECSQQINIVLIGNNGSKRQLKRELKHFHHDIPAFHANRQLLTSIGGIKASPTTLLFDKKGTLTAKKRGYVDGEKLSEIANIISEEQCKVTLE